MKVPKKLQAVLWSRDINDINIEKDKITLFTKFSPMVTLTRLNG